MKKQVLAKDQKYGFVINEKYELCSFVGVFMGVINTVYFFDVHDDNGYFAKETSGPGKGYAPFERMVPMIAMRNLLGGAIHEEAEQNTLTPNGEHEFIVSERYDLVSCSGVFIGYDKDGGALFYIEEGVEHPYQPSEKYPRLYWFDSMGIAFIKYINKV